MSKIAKFIIFAAGTAIGATVTMQYFKRKYEQISQAEINSVKEVFAKKKEDIPDEVKVFKPKEKKNMADTNDLEEMQDKIKENGYTNYADIATKKDGKTVSVNKPYVISPEEFGEDDDYTKISLCYYADQLLADDNDELLDDVENVIGFDSLSHFGDYEDDSVFVRNDKLKCDYEILLDQRTYLEIIKNKPHQAEER